MPLKKSPIKGRRIKPQAPGGITPDFLPLRETIGKSVRKWRQKSGITLRELESRSGVSHSEISKVESGNQSCRLETFIRICTAMGLPAGYILDNSVAFSSKQFEMPIEHHDLTTEISKNNEVFKAVFVSVMAEWVAFVAQIIVCSHPVQKAASVNYPSPDIKNRFIELGYYLESLYQPEKRLELLRSLKERPLDVLQELKLEPTGFIAKLKSMFESEEAGGFAEVKRKMDLIPYNPEIKISLESQPLQTIKNLDSHLPYSSSSAKLSADVKKQLPSLLERLNRATKETGKMSALADHLKVPLASVSRWLSGKREPGGETTLQMLKWVEAQERQK